MRPRYFAKLWARPLNSWGTAFRKLNRVPAQAWRTPALGCLKVLSDVESVLLLILKGEAQEISGAGLPAA
jgi:hypothetical protein